MRGADDLAALLIASPRQRKPCETVGDWMPIWQAMQSAHAGSGPFVAAVASALATDRMAWAFFCGYQGAIQSGFHAPIGRAGTFCANESGRRINEIDTTLSAAQNGALTLSGHKSWALDGIDDLDLYVLARNGIGPAKGPGSLTIVRLPAHSPGVHRGAAHPLAFIPELPHGPIRFESVSLKASDVLSGDGYTDHARPFALREALFIRACVVACLLSEAGTGAWPTQWRERAMAAIWSLRDLCDMDPRDATTAVLAAGALSLSDDVLREAQQQWTSAQQPARARWQRDAQLLALGQDARNQRTARAWQALA